MEEQRICDYGCGQIARYKFKNGKYCCSKDCHSCLGMKKRNKEGNQRHNKEGSIKLDNSNEELCDYGCGQIARYKFKNGKLCCSNNIQSCPIIRKRMSEGEKGKANPLPIKLDNSNKKLCYHGCEQVARYKFANGNLCCSKYVTTCPVISKKQSKSLKGHILTEETKEKIRIGIKEGPVKLDDLNKLLCDYGCGQIAKYKYSNGKLCCNDNVLYCPTIRNKRTFSLKDYQEKYPILIKTEELREHPITGKLQAHCKNHNCKNSKEKGGWFTLTGCQLSERVRALNMYDGSYLYCCEECKQQCPLFNLKSDPLAIPKEINYTSEEYGTFKQEVLKKDNHICHFCGEQKATIVHHTRPQKLEPFFSLDPDFGISVCEECHYFIHRSKEKGGECSTGKLANTMCS
jgi:hypothetical protein